MKATCPTAATSRNGKIRSRSRAICSRSSRASWSRWKSASRRGSGKEKLLQVWVEPHDLDKTRHAMDSLINSIRWDEKRFGLELDLDRFMIVAVSDFNMGAMENKGLNIFNTKYVLANPETATDTDFFNIESVVGHEYFHNWTGNRVTCRDWFQLSLKEGLTVFRDQEFSADMAAGDSPGAASEAARATRRIEDVRVLRQMQFAEDAGPMAHPVRPESYVEINNFYTMTVYEKGSEVVRMYQTLFGRDGFRQGHGPVFQAPRRPGGYLRRLPSRDGRRQRARPRAVRALVQPGGHAARRRADIVRRRREALHRHALAGLRRGVAKRRARRRRVRF